MLEKLKHSIRKFLGDDGSVFMSLWNSTQSNRSLGSYLKAYKGWVYPAVSAIAEEVATIDLRLYSVKGKNRVDVTDLDLPPLKVLKDANDTMTFYDLVELYQVYQDLVGRCFWYTPLLNGKPVEIYPLVPSRVQIAKTDENKVAGYVFTNNSGKQIPLTPEEVVYIRRIDPLDPYTGGYSPAMAGAVSIDTWENASNWNKNFFKNSAIPEGVLKTDQSLTETQLKQLKEAWESEYGGVANAKRTAILQKGLSYEQIQVSPKDMDFVNLKQSSRDEILAMYRVPRTVVGITDDVNRANAETTDYVFSKRVVAPRMQKFVNALNEFYLPKFNMHGSYEFDFIDPTPQDQQSTFTNNQIGIQSGFMTQNEARAEIGLDPVKGGDTLYIPFNFMPSTGAGTNDKKDLSQKVYIQVPAEKKTVEEKKLNKDVIEPEKVTRQNNRVGQMTGVQQAFYASYFKEQGAWVSKKIKGVGKKGIEQDYFEVTVDSDEWRMWLEKLGDPVTEHALNALIIGANDSFEELGLPNSKFSLTEEAKAWIKEYVAKEIKFVDDYTRGAIRDMVYAGTENRLGSDAIASQILQTFDEFSAYRAERIARTETASSYSQGTLFGYKESGLVKQVYWKTAGDGKVSDLCRANEAQGPIKIGSVFSSGNQTPPSHPNCRCVLIPVVD